MDNYCCYTLRQSSLTQLPLLLLLLLLILLFWLDDNTTNVESFSISSVDRTSSCCCRRREGRLLAVDYSLDCHHLRRPPLLLLSSSSSYHTQWQRDRQSSLLVQRVRRRRQEQFRLFGERPNVTIRDWEEQSDVKGPDIYSFLNSAIESTCSRDIYGIVFDPEGPLDYDCGTDESIRESYDTEDGSCFLVATRTSELSNNSIVGTAAVVVGTSVSYMKSGASLSTPQIVTGAIRRVAIKVDHDDSTDDKNDDNFLLQDLLVRIESHAKHEGVQELILLAYPSSSSSSLSYLRPSPQLVESMGYIELPMKSLVNVMQYCKNIL